MSLWHYTTMVALPEIMEAGYLRTTPLNPNPGERAAVWATTSDEWDPTAAKKMYLQDKRTGELTDAGLTTFEGLCKLMGVARIGLREHPDWLDFQTYALREPEQAERLVNGFMIMKRKIAWADEKCGPEFWRARFAPVPRSEFVTVQIYAQEGWVDL